MQETPRAPGTLVPRNKYLLALTVATLIVGLLQATDVIELPFGTWFSPLSGSILSSSALNGFMSTWGYLALFALMALESASLPVPSEVVLPLAGYFVYAGVMNFWVAVAVSTAASLTGALVDYYLAIWLGRPFVVQVLRLFRLHKGALDRAEAWFERSGQWTVFAARFVPGLRTVISLPAGLFRLSLSRFVVMTVAGCFAWSVILIYAGLLAGSSQQAVTAFTSSSLLIDYLSGLVAAVSAAYVVYYALGSRIAWARKPTPSSVS
ncbi:MAG: DedA family protein [Thaumarchaeota archaeon]|nr:DedA family protein [Nitrososphaerota archaeon]